MKKALFGVVLGLALGLAGCQAASPASQAPDETSAEPSSAQAQPTPQETSPSPTPAATTPVSQGDTGTALATFTDDGQGVSITVQKVGQWGPWPDAVIDADKVIGMRLMADYSQSPYRNPWVSGGNFSIVAPDNKRVDCLEVGSRQDILTAIGGDVVYKGSTDDPEGWIYCHPLYDTRDSFLGDFSILYHRSERQTSTDTVPAFEYTIPVQMS